MLHSLVSQIRKFMMPETEPDNGNSAGQGLDGSTADSPRSEACAEVQEPEEPTARASEDPESKDGNRGEITRLEEQHKGEIAQAEAELFQAWDAALKRCVRLWGRAQDKPQLMCLLRCSDFTSRSSSPSRQ